MHHLKSAGETHNKTTRHDQLLMDFSKIVLISNLFSVAYPVSKYSAAQYKDCHPSQWSLTFMEINLLVCFGSMGVNVSSQRKSMQIQGKHTKLHADVVLGQI